MNGGTPFWPRARITSPPFAPHPFGDHPHFSPCAGATGKRVLTARVLGTGGQGPRAQDQLQGPGLVSTVLAGTQRPGPLPISVYGPSPLSWDPGPLPDGTGSQLPEAVLWAQAPGCFLGRAASLRTRFRCFRKQEEHATAALKAALGVSWHHLHSVWGRCNELGRAVSATGRGLRAAEAWAGSALADARPRALSTDKAPSPRPGHPQPACGSVEGLWLGCSRHSGRPLPGCRHLILLVARALERS